MELAINELAGADLANADRPLVILHGLLGSGRNWLGPAKKLNAAGRRVVLADMRNHGHSPWGEPMTYPAMAEDVAELIKRLSTGPVDLLGHSMGGKAAMTLALSQPELVERLIVVDIAPVAYGHRSFADFIDAMRKLNLSQVKRRGDADTAMAADVPDIGMRAFLLQNLEGAEGGGFRWRVDLELLSRALPDMVGWQDPPGAMPFEKPTLVLRGALSPYVQGEGVAALHRLFPEVQIEAVPEAGHWPHVEAAEAFMAALQAFLRR